MTVSPKQPSESASVPDRCVLLHRGFGTLGTIVFRHSEADHTPVMSVTLGDRAAAIPLRSLQKELGIVHDSPDGRMLNLIIESLEYVSELRPGDPLPREVVDGGASWEPGPEHRVIAAGRLRIQLLSWINPRWRGGGASDGEAIRRLDEDRTVRQQVHLAFDQAARTIGLASGDQVVERLAELSEEFAYIEALRERLLQPATQMAARVDRLWRSCRGDADRQETLGQVSRLAGVGLRAINGRFAEVDALSADVMAALRDADGRRNLVRAHRDRLYRTQRAWAPLLREWAAADEAVGETSWLLIGRTYQFLAPRYVQAQEWQSLEMARAPGKSRKLGNVMQW